MDTISQDTEARLIESYNKKRMGQFKKRRELRKTKIFREKLKAFFRLIYICALIALFLFVIRLPQWYPDKTIFTSYPNKYLEIEGNSIMSSMQVLNALKPLKIPDKPIYLMDTKYIEDAVLKLTPVKKVFIRRYWFPARLRIVIDERTPVIGIAPTPKVPPIAVFTNDDGVIKILGKPYLPLPADKSIYKIITYDQFSSWKLAQVQYITHLANYVEDISDKKVVYIDIRNPDDVFIQLQDVKLRIGPINGSTTFSNIDKIPDVMPEAMKIKQESEYVDLRWDNVSIKLKNKKPQEKNSDKKLNDD